MRLAQILELLEHTPIFSAGYKCILHIHSVVEECECTEMRYELDPKTKSKKKVLHSTSPVSAYADPVITQVRHCTSRPDAACGLTAGVCKIAGVL